MLTCDHIKAPESPRPMLAADACVIQFSYCLSTEDVWSDVWSGLRDVTLKHHAGAIRSGTNSAFLPRILQLCFFSFKFVVRFFLQMCGGNGLFFAFAICFAIVVGRASWCVVVELLAVIICIMRRFFIAIC